MLRIPSDLSLHSRISASHLRITAFNQLIYISTERVLFKKSNYEIWGYSINASQRYNPERNKTSTDLEQAVIWFDLFTQ